MITTNPKETPTLMLARLFLQIRTELQELQQGLEAMESHLTAAAATCTHSEPHLPEQYAFVAAAHDSLRHSVKAESDMTELSERLSAYFGKAGEHERVLGALKDFGPMVGSALKGLQATPDVTLVEDSKQVSAPPHSASQISADNFHLFWFSFLLCAGG